MKRETGIEKIRSRQKPWDIIVIGGGATGLGIAVDAAARNYSVLLLEQYDFAKGTSSRSTKLVHGGVRYLQQGNMALVFEALRERGIMKRNAPHLVNDLSFIIPAYEWWDAPYYMIGLKVYDFMAGNLGLGPSVHVSRREAMEFVPTIEERGLRGGVIFHDGQFDDARMAISLALTADDYGAVLLNYMKVEKVCKTGSKADGVEAVDTETGERFLIPGKVVINAAGVFADDVLKMDNPLAKASILPSQGIHLVLDKQFLPGNHAFLIPETSDGRILFAVPWYDKVILGTTDTLIKETTPEPVAMDDEIDFVLENASKFLSKKPGRADVKSVFAGLRPLVLKTGSKSTKELSRSHKITVSDSGLISVIGGKWTTYRKMAEDAVGYAILVGDLEERKCLTEDLLIHGYVSKPDFSNPLHVYGNDVREILRIEGADSYLSAMLSESLKIRKSQVVWAVRYEMARTLEDVLARRTRALFLDARETLKISEETAKIMARELNQGTVWIEEQMNTFKKIAASYIISL